MSEETETAEQQLDSEAEEAVEETAIEGDGSESAEDAQEAETEEKPKPKPPVKRREAFDLERAREKIRKQNSEAENLRKRLREYEDRDKTESQRLADQLAQATEQVAKTRKRLVRTQVQALASSPVGERAAFTDPEDALGALDLDSYIDEDGDIDEAAIEADLQALLERKPHWAKTAQPQEGPRRPAPDRTQASGANKTKAPSPRDEFAGWLSTQLK